MATRRATGFTLRIDLGNEAMQTGSDVAEALRRVASSVENGQTFLQGESSRIRDLNGNAVGEWKAVRS